MKIKFNQGIGIYENAFSDEWCDNVIDFFQTQQHKQYSREKIGAVEYNLREDTAIDLHICSPEILESFNSIFFDKIYPSYSYRFSELRHYGFHSIIYAKVQKTLPTQGFHAWHSESGRLDTVNRISAFTLYLNDVEEGGETEFLHQSLRLSPKKGTVAIWPAGYYHTHRGNPPLSGEKYIMTGWIELIPEIIKKMINK